MGLAEDVAEIGRRIDTLTARNPWCVVVVDDDNPPPEIRGETLDSPGWIVSRVLPSTLTEIEVVAVEHLLGVQFPPSFRAYLLARFHLIDQCHAASFQNQLVCWPCVPSRQSFDPVVRYVRSWRALLGAGYIPFAQWGDGWGPMCFDTARRAPDGECPVVWMDHELLHGPLHHRSHVEPLARPLYANSREMIFDLFAPPHETPS
jgi:hypothetical protein